MPRVRFTQNFDWKPTPGSTIAYRAGMEMPVTRRCAAQAVAKGRAELIGRRRDGGGKSQGNAALSEARPD
jgi:hypothetical protein